MADPGGTPIVHLGLGAFARAHLATYAQDLLDQGHDARITGISLRSSAIATSLSAQGHRYSVVTRDGDGREEVRWISAITDARTGPEAAVAAMADPACHLVTLTVTEAGYGVVPGTSGADAVLDAARLDVAHDLALLATRRPTAVRGADLQTVPGVLAVALARRRAAGAGAPTLVPLDNQSFNGATLRAAVVSMARAGGADLAAWIADEVAFPSTVVDRIVPATPVGLSAHLEQAHGIVDAVPVLAEPHRSWAVEASSVLRPWASVGVEVVLDVTAHQRRKLWLLNGPHSASALAGVVRGHDTIADAIADPAIEALARGLADEATEVAGLPPGLDAAGFAAEARRRFANPVLGHRCAQVATDSEHKLPVRVVPVIEARVGDGGSAPSAATVVATWLATAPAAAAGHLLVTLSPRARAAVVAAAPFR